MKKAIVIKILIFTVLAGCNNEPKVHEHEHGPAPLAYTQYSDKTEIFVEFKPLVVGQVVKFAAHFTLLGERFLPLPEGSVSVSLVVGSNGIRQQTDTPAVSGIYRLSLKPATAGIGKLVFDIKTKTFTDQVTIDSIKVYPDEQSALADQHEKPGSTDITFLKEQAWKIEFANMPVKKQPFYDVVKTSGQILPAPGDEIVIAAKAKGIVLFTGINSIVGSGVNAGEILFRISGGDMAMDNVDATYRTAKSDYEKAKADYERASELVKDKIVSQKEYLDAKLKYDNALITYNTLSKNYSASGQGVSTPIKGFIKNILVTEGQFVETGTPLATVSKNKKLVLQANMAQRYFDKLPNISAANFKTTDSDKLYSTNKLNGKLISYGKSAAASTPYLPVTFEIDNEGDIIPGSVAEVYLKFSVVADALVVPASSLIEEQGTFFVYVQTEGESFQKREVKLGASDGINVQLLSGVAEGERVVTKGGYQIKLSTASGTLPAHGHEH